MTVKSIQETQESNKDLTLLEIASDLSGKSEGKECMEDRTTGDSSMEEKWRNNCMGKIGFVHSQVLRIREEELHLGEDIGQKLSAAAAKDKFTNAGFGQSIRRLDMILFSRPILPCSPLSGKPTVKALP